MLTIAIWGLGALVILAVILYVVVLMLTRKSRKIKQQLQEAEVKAELAKSGAERNFVPHS